MCDNLILNISLQVLITTGVSHEFENQDIAWYTSEIVRHIVPEGNTVFLSISEDGPSVDKVGYHRMERKLRYKRFFQLDRIKCPPSTPLTQGYDYHHATIYRNEHFLRAFTKLKWPLISPFTNLMYNEHQDNIIRNIHSLQSWTLLVENMVLAWTERNANHIIT